MSAAVAITGVGTLNAAFAGGAETLAAWLSEPRPATRPVDDFPAPVALLPRGVLEVSLDEAQARRLSRVSQLAVVAARLALDDAGQAPVGDLGLIVGTEFGDLRSTMEFADGYLDAGPTGLSALLFPNTVMNTMAAATSIALRTRGLSLTLNEATIAGELAVAQAASAVAAGRVSAALAGGVDQADAFLARSLGALGMPPVPRGEGATFLVLETLEAARARGARVLGRIAGTACRALPARPHGVGRTCRASAVAAALDAAGAAPAAVARVYAATNGDPARDAWEARLLDAAFAHHPPRTALRGFLGDHAGVGPLGVAAAALATTSRGPWAARPRTAVGLVHGVARGGAHVALVVGGAEGAA